MDQNTRTALLDAAESCVATARGLVQVETAATMTAIEPIVKGLCDQAVAALAAATMPTTRGPTTDTPLPKKP